MVERLRRLLGDTGTVQAFTDVRLTALLADAANDLDRALLAGLNELRAEAAKQVNFSVGPESESAGQLFDHLTILSAEVTTRIADRASGGGVARIGTLATPVKVAF